jgi:hypothetical protein
MLTTERWRINRQKARAESFAALIRAIDMMLSESVTGNIEFFVGASDPDDVAEEVVAEYCKHGWDAIFQDRQGYRSIIINLPMGQLGR